MDELAISAIQDQIRRLIEQDGLDPKPAADQVLHINKSMKLPGIEEIVPVALERFLEAQHKIKYLKLPSIPRSRQDDWYGGPTANGIWAGLKKYLLEVKKWNWKKTVKSIDDSSTKIVSLLDKPGKRSFATRSLVVGYVQSGKTANMTAVAAKAVDANYKFVIVLAGMTNTLRSQTQARLEKDLIQWRPERWNQHTTVDEDFAESPDLGFHAPNPGSRNIAVIKKNKFVLDRFIKKLDKTPEQHLRNIPFLIIDDECDQASVNTAKYRSDMTAINGAIRTILQKLPRCAYIGYTATPFANVLIDPSVSADPNQPDDLYPTDFIVALPEPTGYFGSESLFGRGLLDADEDLDESDGLDMIRIVEDEETELLRPASPKVREEFDLTITKSLNDAIKYYLLASAARVTRDQGHEHSCMLIHTTSYIAPHENAKKRIEPYLENIVAGLESGDAELDAELSKLWDSESERVDPTSFGNDPVTYQELSVHLPDVIGSVRVVVENGESDERIRFPDDEVQRYIVIGGNVLARGLTIEGLVVSFFLRTSSQYDSLMQMGRWFGYRDGYEDMPRVWMTRDMRDAFKELATVEQEIRNDIKVFRPGVVTPLDFAVRIRQIPGMSITAKNKMLASETCDISYATEHIQTTRFRHHDDKWLADNWTAGAILMDEANGHCGAAKTVPRGRLYRGVPVGSIIRFLSNYKTHHTHRNFDPDKVSEYIEAANAGDAGYLRVWNVGIVEPKRGSPSSKILGSLGTVRTVVRSLLWETQEKDADIKALMSRADVYLDCDSIGPVGNDGWTRLKNSREDVLSKTPVLLLYPIEAESKPREKKNVPEGEIPNRAPLNANSDVLGVGIIFPSSDHDVPDHYVRVKLPESEYEEPDLAELDEENEEQIDAV